MTTITVHTLIDAPLETCFDLARDLQAHIKSARSTGEKIIGGKTQGLLELGDEVEFEAKHFGLTRRLRSKVTAFDRPHSFTDEMLKGPFRKIHHVHSFEILQGQTLMIDLFEFESPYGSIVDRWILKPYLTKFLVRRGEELKQMAQAT